MRNAALGRKHSENVKKNMSESRKGVNNPFFGKIHTEISLALIKTAAANRVNLPFQVLK